MLRGRGCRGGRAPLLACVLVATSCAPDEVVFVTKDVEGPPLRLSAGDPPVVHRVFACADDPQLEGLSVGVEAEIRASTSDPGELSIRLGFGDLVYDTEVTGDPKETATADTVEVTAAGEVIDVRHGAYFWWYWREFDEICEDGKDIDFRHRGGGTLEVTWRALAIPNNIRDERDFGIALDEPVVLE